MDSPRRAPGLGEVKRMEHKPPPAPNAGPFIGGLIAGFAAGGIVLFPATMLTAAILLSNAKASGMEFLIPSYVFAAGFGIWGFIRARTKADFVTGFLIGTAAGCLGLTALCNLMGTMQW